MLYLWIFGNNIEDVLGPLRFIVFYLVGGVLANLAHVIIRAIIGPYPMIGASGAIAAVLGAYLVLFPRATDRGPAVVLLHRPVSSGCRR